MNKQKNSDLHNNKSQQNDYQRDLKMIEYGFKHNLKSNLLIIIIAALGIVLTGIWMYFFA